MQWKTMIAASAIGILVAGPALALTVTNKDSKEHTIGLDMGNKETVHTIPAGQSLTFKKECDEGCGVTGPWGFSWMARTGDKIETDGKPLVTVTE
jgi:hypothetical protein